MAIDLKKAAGALFKEVGNPSSLTLETAQTLVTQAGTLVASHIGSAPVPPDIEALAVIAVARELHTASQAPGGVFSPFADGAAVRLARDPMKAAYPLLAAYVGGGFA